MSIEDGQRLRDQGDAGDADPSVGIAHETKGKQTRKATTGRTTAKRATKKA